MAIGDLSTLPTALRQLLKISKRAPYGATKRVRGVPKLMAMVVMTTAMMMGGGGEEKRKAGHCLFETRTQQHRMVRKNISCGAVSLPTASSISSSKFSTISLPFLLTSPAQQENSSKAKDGMKRGSEWFK